ncbi:trypsin-like peptidase domain-containing protein [Tropicibacter naphthalenivorans]|uniref:Periplasmic pH-dependent serine endoprotease DegQ n=1 Tax=Tropicibacter naphthalenivorans TaxID=441103 RepID=A0A0P1GBM4_9RHOB|nr:trypsin-like peptidase domain-containing protein [Tropicibacter naphthalenivorans]CUH78823.1 Periplasmic pH-dependent serine endoprotease DegQ precursor [Tropicibacter naphthalenivorans]SMC81664.1 Do/DeqQ family serine protease [Tropicibacter naphthalenivorans]
MLRHLLMILCLIAPLPLVAQTPAIPQSQAQIQLSFAPLVKQAAPAVVNIYARRVVEARSPFADDPFFRNFFGQTQGRPQVQNSLGSGVILTPDGIVVSNYHVVGQATDIRVVLNNRVEYAAKVLLGDEEADLAILQLEDAADMPFVPLRDSDTVEVGELVLAIGNPFGVGQTVSSGIVSGLARTGTATGNGRGYFIQTDAPINPGNSGGALIDVQGRLIGVNTSILTRSGGSNGIGFAIPSALVAQFVEQAKNGATRFQRPWAGITGQPVDADISDSLGLSVPGGVVITQMHPASGFAGAGLRVGDVILEVDGQPVNTPAEMLFRMSIRGIGHDAEIAYLSRGVMKSATVTMMTAPEVPPRETVNLGERSVLPGLKVARINPAVSAELGLPPGLEGVVVLDPGPYGARVGLAAGDLLGAIDGARVTSPREVDGLLRRAAPSIRIDALRGNRRLQLRFRI